MISKLAFGIACDLVNGTDVWASLRPSALKSLEMVLRRLFE